MTRLLLLASIAAAAASAALAQPCTPALLAERDAAAPEIIADDGGDLVAAVEEAYGCVADFSDPALFAPSAFDREGAPIGDVARVETEAFGSVSLVLARRGEKALLPAERILRWTAEGLVADVGADDLVWQPDYGTETLAAHRPSQRPRNPVSREESRALFDWQLWRVFEPTPKIALLVTSSPTNAGVRLDQTDLGRTWLERIIPEKMLETLVLSKPGYKPCVFADGRLEDTPSRGRRIFSCTLQPES